MKFTINLHLVLSLEMGRQVPGLPVYAFFAWTGTCLCLYFKYITGGFTLEQNSFLSGKITVRAKNSCNPYKVVPFLTGHEYYDAVRACKFLVSLILCWLQTEVPEVPGQEATCEHKRQK